MAPRFWTRTAAFAHILGVVCFHVDDVIATFAEWLPDGRSCKEKFFSLFDWGSLNENDFVFKGVHFRHNPAKGECRLDMQEYSSKLSWPNIRDEPPGPLPKNM